MEIRCSSRRSSIAIAVALCFTTALVSAQPDADARGLRATGGDPPPPRRAPLSTEYVDALLALRVAPVPRGVIPDAALSPALRDAIAGVRTASRWETRPPRASAAYTSWLTRELARRMEAMRAVEAAFRPFATYDEPSVERLIGGAMVAQLYGAFASDFVALPLPPSIHAEPEAVAPYRAHIAEQSVVLFARAGDAFAFCAQQLICRDPAFTALCDHCRTQSDAIARVLALASATR